MDGKEGGEASGVNRGASGWQRRWRGKQPTAAPHRAHQRDRSFLHWVESNVYRLKREMTKEFS